MLDRAAIAALCLAASACGSLALAGSGTAHDPDTFGALPEVTVCVVDRASDTGLREISARRAHDGSTVLLVGDRVVPLDSVHAPGVVAGYATGEPWFDSDSISFRNATFVKVQRERRIAIEQLTRVGDLEGIPVFAGTSDESPFDAVYLPTRPGCVFQAYVREDLM